MFNMNSGYVGASRSVRSQEAVDSYEVPMSMIKKALIEDFLDEQDDFTSEDINFLSKVSVAKWKYVASERMSVSSWHHTSSYFNETYHYSLCSISDKLLEIKDTLDTDYKEYRDSKKKEVSDVKYGVIKVQVWGGSRKRPRLEGYEEVAGIVVGDWLFYKNNHSINGCIAKFKTTANKVEWLKEYDSYADLTKNHKEYKNTKKVFNNLISEKRNIINKK
ncbi:MAG: hypothetical protein WC292_00185 [Clostridia bacterium]